ncbi:hypothetical protein BH11PSE13_BH11PSE13_28280 [soil metagenome]
MNPQELKTIMGSGLLSFPLTDFDSHGDFDKKGYEKRLEWLSPYGATALFAAEKAGAHGMLLLPHYLTEAGQEGLAAHVEAVCKSVKFGVIVYNRATSRLKPETLAGLAERNPNLVGFKDGVGDIEAMVAICVKAGATLVGHSPGPVRPPLTDLKPDEMEMLKVLIDKLGPQ